MKESLKPKINIEDIIKSKEEKNGIILGYSLFDRLYSSLGYKNRARKIGRGSNYILEEMWGRHANSSYVGINVIRGYEKVDECLYRMAKKASKTILDYLTPVIVDNTQIFRNKQKKQK